MNQFDVAVLTIRLAALYSWFHALGKNATYTKMRSRIPIETVRRSLLVVSAVGGAVLSMSLANGAIITVFSDADSGPGTLRQAIFDASAGDTINFSINFAFGEAHEIRLSSGELLLNKDLTIEGPGANKFGIGGGEGRVGRVFRIAFSAT